MTWSGSPPAVKFKVLQNCDEIAASAIAARDATARGESTTYIGPGNDET